MKTKNFLASLLAIAFSTLWVQADEWTFSLTEVKVTNQNTINLSFNKDVLEDVSFFEFLLTPKSDDTKEVGLSDIKLIGTNVLEAHTAEPLTANEEYNLVVVFASDKEGNVIENGVDWIAAFTAPASFASGNEVSSELNAAPMESSVTPQNEVPQDNSQNNVDMSVQADTTTVVSTETAAATADALPQTGPKEMLFVVLALLLGLGLTYVRRKA